MKRLFIISTLVALVLPGCAHTGYQGGYGRYGTTYGMSHGGMYSSGYPATVYYQQNIMPGPIHRPLPGAGFGIMPSRDWNRFRDHHEYHDYHQHRDHLRDLERRQERQQRAIRRGFQRGDLSRTEAEMLKQENRRIENHIDRAQRQPWVPNMKREWIENDLDRAGSRIRSLKNDGIGHDDDRWGQRRGWGDGRGRDWGGWRDGHDH
ncbi:MAG: hypothetical protein KGZ80_03025 [Methylomonas sp.]|nr:hypothetical protein [Methylomonas sp.]PPD22786.1 MAG: hypothetical protein CTY23_00190 [Methylomonas sp.]PPD23907.1 MAG: hypothetical protein CTY22_11695 [Methylomonas sp.]PPD31961.1 MAG: hypothetical protein CTY21_11660 [Methylomonas sp.]PPD42775.1 MAG: hypothetical protein CTY17_00275 [Methylomonas sp.]